MKSIGTPAVILTLLAATACMSPKYLPQAPANIQKGPISIALSEKLESDGSLALNEAKTIRYTQPFGGGGVSVGLLLGPIGAAANAAAIKSNTEKDAAALKGIITLDPTTLFREAARDCGLKEGEEGIKISPYLFISKITEEGRLVLAANLLIEHGAGEGRYQARMTYQLACPGSLDPKTMAPTISKDRLDSLVQEGFKAILKRMQTETAESIAAEKEVIFSSKFVFPRFNVEMYAKLIDDSGDRVWLRTASGLFSLLKEDVTYRAK